MNYINAAEVLPLDLLEEVQKYMSSGLLYIPENKKKAWGRENGSRDYFLARNAEIREQYKTGASFDDLAQKYGLAYTTIKKIVYRDA